MMKVQFILVFVFMSFSSALASNEEWSSSVREARARFFLISPTKPTCLAVDGREGYCLPQRCRINQLKDGGPCVLGLGRCCIVEESCGATTMTNNTYFVNPGFPNATYSTGNCSLTVQPFNSNVCQIRLDFIQFQLHQPDSSGFCTQDLFKVTGTNATNVPTLCGTNTNQHMYVNVGPNTNVSAIGIHIIVTELSFIDRKWNIRVTQIPCDSTVEAPKGCLQYHTTKSGFVQSFNYAAKLDIDQSTRQISNVAYTTCIRQELGYCSVSWSRYLDQQYSFTVSGNVTAFNETLIGNSTLMSTTCRDDFIVIPNGVDPDGNHLNNICGLGFPLTVKSEMTPFFMYSKTSANETNDFGNRGHNLVFTQIRC